MDDATLIQRYRENTGRAPRSTLEGNPLRWQWEYRGTKKEREAMALTMGLVQEEEGPVIIEGQEEMF